MKFVFKKTGKTHMFYQFYLALLALTFLCASSHAQMTNTDINITVQGLFKNTAVVTINGEQRILKVGKKTAEGILLLEANSSKALVDINGERQTLYIGKEIGAAYQTPEANIVRIAAGHNGHHIASGRINGINTQFLVDTGASSIAMNSIDAKRLNVEYLSGQKMSAATASGIAQGYHVNLHSVTVGTITLHNVKAIVLEGEFPQKILLGNTFLSEVDIKTEQGVLILQAKY